MAEMGKVENLLQMALQLSQAERGSDNNLSAGYSRENRTWELIVKYHGDLSRVRSKQIQVEPLLYGYAIVTIPQSLILAFTELEEIEYIEKPKLLLPQIEEGIRASCIWPVWDAPYQLTGRNILVGIIDSGIAYESPAFLNPDGSTRIAAIYDQSLSREFTREEINEALQKNVALPTTDITGHGTAVASIAAGSGAPNQGVAYDSELLIVKLATANQNSYPMTTNLLRAFYYMVTKAEVLNRPIAINLSFGNTYGSHDGESLVERFMDNISEYGRNVICVGSGNEGASSGHTSGIIETGNRVASVPFFVGNYETQLSLQFWKSYEDNYEITLVSPGREAFTLPMENTIAETVKTRLEQTQVAAFIGQPQPYSINQEFYFHFQPEGNYINTGIWEIQINPIKRVTGEYNLYLPSATVISGETRFLEPTADSTITIPATARKVISVGAYDSRFNAYGDFSGRGFVARQTETVEEQITEVKPDLVAPGVGIVTTNGRESVTVNGTSFATPFVTGSAALLMEWGIVQGNDPYLYGEKVKAYIRKGARQLPGMETPNPMTAYGALCVRESLPR